MDTQALTNRQVALYYRHIRHSSSTTAMKLKAFYTTYLDRKDSCPICHEKPGLPWRIHHLWHEARRAYDERRFGQNERILKVLLRRDSGRKVPAMEYLAQVESVHRAYASQRGPVEVPTSPAGIDNSPPYFGRDGWCDDPLEELIYREEVGVVGPS